MIAMVMVMDDGDDGYDAYAGGDDAGDTDHDDDDDYDGDGDGCHALSKGNSLQHKCAFAKRASHMMHNSDYARNECVQNMHVRMPVNARRVAVSILQPPPNCCDDRQRYRGC